MYIRGFTAPPVRIGTYYVHIYTSKYVQLRITCATYLVHTYVRTYKTEYVQTCTLWYVFVLLYVQRYIKIRTIQNTYHMYI